MVSVIGKSALAWPTGGATGQALQKTSTAPGAAGWIDPTVGGVPSPYFRSGAGDWFDTRWLGGVPGSGSAAAGWTYYVSYYSPVSFTINALGIYSPDSAAPASNAKLGISSSTAAGKPGTLLRSATVSGTGALTAAVTATTVPAGWCFLSVGTASGTSVAIVTSQATRFTTTRASLSVGVNAYSQFTDTGSAGAVKSNPTVGNFQGSGVMLVWFKVV